MNHRRSATAAFVALLMAGATLVAQPANAASNGVSATNDPITSACMVNVDDGKETCVKGDGEDLKKELLINHNTVMATADDAGRAEVAAASRQSLARGEAAAATSWMLGTVYDNKNWGGSVLYFTTSISTACITHSFTWNDLNYAYWYATWDDANDDISSYVPAPTCKMWLYSDFNRTGAVLKLSTQKSTLGSFNEIGSSLWFTG